MTSSTCAESSIQLKIEDLSNVQDVLTPVSHKCIIFGSKISVPHNILAGIEETNCNFDKKLYKVLEYRLKQLPLLKWHDIVRALRSPAVHEQVLALEIESQYIPCSSSQSQLASDQSSAPIGPDIGVNTPTQEMQQVYFPYHSHSHHYTHSSFSGSALQLHDNLSCFPNTIPPPAQCHPPIPQHRIHPPVYPIMYPPPHSQMHPPHPQVHPPHLRPQMHPRHLYAQIHPQHPHSQMYSPCPSPPQPQMYQYPYPGSSPSFINPTLSFNPPVITSQPVTGTARKRSSFEQVNVSSQACSVSAQPRSFGLYSRQSQPLMAAPPSAKKHCIEPYPSLSLTSSDSGSKALFHQFIQYVKILYRSSPLEERTEVLKLRTPGKMFINLACIDRKTEGLKTEYDEITEAMIRDGNVDVIHGRKCPIDMNEIAANVPAETIKKVILVEGAPGVGKSTFAWEFCRRWERGEIAQQYDLVLLLRLRDKTISKAKCLKDLIYHHSEKVCEAVVSELESCLGVNVLLIFEGYDELSDECRESSLFLELINGRQLPFATLLITSRPWATCDVRRNFEHRIFQHIEVLGFTKEQITTYIRSVLSEEEALDLEECLRKQSTVRMCMYIPLNCAIVVTVYQESKADGVALPTTLSEFYISVSCAILLRYLRVLNISSKPFENLDNLPAAVKIKFSFLCQLAYDGIAGPCDQVKLIFTDLPEDFDGLGFMDSVFELYETRKAVASHNFLHLIFQEFLAAVHISSMEVEQRLQHFKRHKEGRLRVVLRFLAGITKLKDFSTHSSFAGLLDQPRKCGYTAIDYTIRPHVCTWVYEALGKEIIETAFHEDVTVEFADDFSDSPALGYCITHSCCKWVLSVWSMDKVEIDILVDESQASDSTGGIIVGLRGGFDESMNTFKGLSVSFTELNRIFTGLHIRLSELALKLPAKCSQISWPDLSSLQSLTIDTTTYKEDKTMNWELDYLLPQLSLSSLTLFTLLVLPFEDSKAVSNFIANTSTLKYLHIFVYHSLIAMDQIFAAIIEKEVRLNITLGIRASKIDNEVAENLAYYIRTTVLSKLVFPDLEFSAFGALQVARALRTVPDLEADKLYFVVTTQRYVPHAFELINDYSDLLDKTIHSYQMHNVRVSFLLPDSTTSEWGFKVKGGVDDVVVEHLAEAVRNNSSVQALRLRGITFDVGAKALVEAVNCNNVLEELQLSQNEASGVSIEALGKAFGSKTALKKLSLSNNNIGDAGAKAFADILKCNNIVEELYLSYNKIGNGGVEALAEALGSNTALKQLYLCGNDIGDVGAKALAEVLICNSILETLHLSCNKIGNGGAEALAETLGSNAALKQLDLSRNDIGDVGAKALAEVLICNSILETLHLSCNKIGNGGAEALAEALGSNTALKTLNLINNNIGDAGAKALAEVLNCNNIFEELILSYNKIGNGGAEALAEALGSNTALKTLHLSNNNIGDAGAKAFAEVLNCNSILDILFLSCNKIGSVGTKALAEALRSNTALKKLDLSDNDIGDVGAKALAKLLNCKTILQELDLSCNKIGSVGTEALAKAIGSNTALKKLVLYDISDVGVISLAQALHSNSSLEVLKLVGSYIQDSGAKAFAEALHHNSTITHLDLCLNEDVGEEGVHHLIQALTVNKSISENGLILDRKGFKCALRCSGYRNVEYKIQWL